MTELLQNYLGGRWQRGNDSGATLLDPVLGTPLVRIDAPVGWIWRKVFVLPVNKVAKRYVP